VGPKTDRSEMITVNRPADYFRNHVVGGAESDRAKPEKKQIVREPPAHRRLHHALHRHDEEHQLRGRVEPREPEKGAEQIPLRDVNLIAAPETEHEHGPGNDERVSDEKDDRRVGRKLEPLITGAVARENSADAEQHTKIPKTATGHEQKRMSQNSAAQ